MKTGKLAFLWVLILLTACATQNSIQNGFSKLPSLEEQCEILSKKREPVKVKKIKRKPNKTKKNQEFQKNPELVSTKPEFLETSDSNSLNEDVVPCEPIERENISNTSEVLLVSEHYSTPKKKSLNYKKAAKADDNVLLLNSTPEKQEQFIPGIEDNFIVGLIGISGILGMLLLSASQQQSMQISHWALKNPWKARGIITVAHLISGTGALIMGDQLSADGLVVSETAKYIALSAIATAVCLYPITRSTNYLKPRFCEALLFASGVTMMVYAGNQYGVVQQQHPQNSIYSFATNSKEYSWHLVKKEISIPKQKAQDSPKKKSKGDKVGLTIFACIGFTMLEFLVAALSCSLSCNGSEAAAAIVGFGGTAGVIIGLFFVIKSIFRDGRKRKVKDSDPPTYKS